MERTIDAYLTMFEHLKLMCEKNQSKWASSQPFSDAFQVFVTKMEAAREFRLHLMDDSKGRTEFKQSVRKDLEAAGMKLSSGLASYSSSVGDDHLLALVLFYPTDFKSATQLSLLGLVEKLRDKAADNLALLASFGISQPTIDQTNDLIKAFNKADDVQKTSKKERSNNALALKELVLETRSLLTKKLDLYARLVAHDHPEFLWVYKEARRLHILGRRHLALMLKVVDGQTGAAVSNARVEIHPENIKRKASKLGNLRIRNLKEGKQRIVITAEGYETQTLEREYSTEKKLKEEVRLMR
jgi:hypothetical protein